MITVENKIQRLPNLGVKSNKCYHMKERNKHLKNAQYYFKQTHRHSNRGSWERAKAPPLIYKGG